jgi:hypothetical protein
VGRGAAQRSSESFRDFNFHFFLSFSITPVFPLPLKMLGWILRNRINPKLSPE